MKPRSRLSKAGSHKFTVFPVHHNSCVTYDKTNDNKIKQTDEIEFSIWERIFNIEFNYPLTLLLDMGF